MKHDPIVVGVAGMAVACPVPLLDVDLHVPPDQAHSFNLQQCVSKVGACGSAGTARIDHPYGGASLRPQVCLAGSPLLPEAGYQPLRDSYVPTPFILFRDH